MKSPPAQIVQLSQNINPATAPDVPGHNRYESDIGANKMPKSQGNN